MLSERIKDTERRANRKLFVCYACVVGMKRVVERGSENWWYGHVISRAMLTVRAKRDVS